MNAPPPISHPKLIEIDNALTELEPAMEEFARLNGYDLWRGHGGSHNIPRRGLRRQADCVSHAVDLVVASPMPERLERGFYLELPCALYIRAQTHLFPEPCHWYHTVVVEAQPYCALVRSLAQSLADAGARLDACTPDFVSQHGSPA